MCGIRSVLAMVILGLGLVLGLSSAALAGDWQAIKLRGGVFAFVGDAWVPISRGDVVPDDRIVRTAPNGRVQFQRDGETIELGPDTQIRIFDPEGKRFTVVQQHFGEVAIEAEPQAAQHFAVQTQFLVAVVKGTKFTVRAWPDGAIVSVDRGQVEVRDTIRNLVVDVAPGQNAGSGATQPLSIGGSGDLAPIEGYRGKAPAESAAVAGAASNEGAINGNSANGNASGNGNAGANSNAGGNSNGVGNSENSNAGGSASDNSSANDAASAASASGNAYGHDNATTAPGNSENSNAGGNGNSKKND